MLSTGHSAWFVQTLGHTGGRSATVIVATSLARPRRLVRQLAGLLALGIPDAHGRLRPGSTRSRRRARPLNLLLECSRSLRERNDDSSRTLRTNCAGPSRTSGSRSRWPRTTRSGPIGPRRPTRSLRRMIRWRGSSRDCSCCLGRDEASTRRREPVDLRDVPEEAVAQAAGARPDEAHHSRTIQSQGQSRRCSVRWRIRDVGETFRSVTSTVEDETRRLEGPVNARGVVLRVRFCGWRRERSLGWSSGSGRESLR